MKIGYDAKRAFLNRTGLGNYSRWLIKTLAAQYPDHTYHLYTPKVKPNGLARIFEGYKNIFTITPSRAYFSSWWRSIGVLKNLQQDGVALYHGLSHELPYGINKSGIKSVVTVHDLIVLRYPQYFSRINRFIYLSKLKYACKVANGIVAVSLKTKQDLVDLLGIAPDKITVVYQGADRTFSVKKTEEQKETIRKKHQLPPEFILNVGTIEQRKNLLLLVKALLKVDNTIPLVVIGKKTKYQDDIDSFLRANHVASRVIFLKDIPFDDLPAIYQLASVFVYPSRYEGFGIPILEALHSGVPVIAATGSCLEEAGGPGSLYGNPDDDTLLAAHITQVLNNAELRTSMITKGYEHLKNFTDNKLAAQLMDFYQSTINHA